MRARPDLAVHDAALRRKQRIDPAAWAFGMVLTALPTIVAYAWLPAHWLGQPGE